MLGLVSSLLISSLALTGGAVAHAWEAGKFTKPKQVDLKRKLTSLQYSVTQEADTERPFNNPFWDQHDEGIYVDIVSGEPLFSSKDKFDSGTGWPSFSKPLVPAHITMHVDKSGGGERIEVRSRYARSHLGHVFNDGPAPAGERYCMNSASLRFIPKDKLKSEGYAEFADQFALSPSAKTVVLTGGKSRALQNAFAALEGQGLLNSQAGLIENREALQVRYDSKKISLERILELYWKNIDPFDGAGTFCDRGEKYASAIFIEGEDDKRLVEHSFSFVRQKAKVKGEIKTKILPLAKFNAADDKEQNYAQKNQTQFQNERRECGQDKRSAQIWGGK